MTANDPYRIEDAAGRPALRSMHGQALSTGAEQMNSTRFRLVVPSMLLMALLAGCTTADSAGAGRGLVSARTSPSTPYIAALQGGIVSRSGVQLSDSDRARALEAEYRALEAARGGQPVAWSGKDVSGQVTAAAPYQVGAQNCRQYRHTLVAGGREVKALGTACRNKDGSWTPLT